jgi:hypothetical protein
VDSREARSAATRWECQVAATDPQGDLTILDVTIETPDWEEAIRRSCEGLTSDDIEWVKVRRV